MNILKVCATINGNACKRKNNMYTEMQKAGEIVHKKLNLTDSVVLKKTTNTTQDTGFLHLEDIIRRTLTVSKPVDKEGGITTYAKKIIKSMYNKDGTLRSREISKIKDEFYISTEKTLKVHYFPDMTNSVESEFVKNGVKYTKIAQKGNPTVYLSTLPLDQKIEGLVNIEKIHLKYSHLNKSSLKSVETINHHIQKNGVEQVVQARKTIITKDGRTIIETPHNGGSMIVVSQPKVNTAVYKSTAEIKQFLSTVNDEIRNILQ